MQVNRLGLFFVASCMNFPAAAHHSILFYHLCGRSHEIRFR